MASENYSRVSLIDLRAYSRLEMLHNANNAVFSPQKRNINNITSTIPYTHQSEQQLNTDLI